MFPRYAVAPFYASQGRKCGGGISGYFCLSHIRFRFKQSDKSMFNVAHSRAIGVICSEPSLWITPSDLFLISVNITCPFVCLLHAIDPGRVLFINTIFWRRYWNYESQHLQWAVSFYIKFRGRCNNFWNIKEQENVGLNAKAIKVSRPSPFLGKWKEKVNVYYSTIKEI